MTMRLIFGNRKQRVDVSKIMKLLEVPEFSDFIEHKMKAFEEIYRDEIHNMQHTDSDNNDDPILYLNRPGPVYIADQGLREFIEDLNLPELSDYKDLLLRQHFALYRRAKTEAQT
ncbi:MAG: hypothetical protein ACM3SY_16925 [Candidatus Omnitrophota bacterium]